MKLFEYLRRYKWDLGIALESEGHRYDAAQWKFHIIKAPKDCWYADPFILDVNETDIIVLVEEYSYNIKRGRLAKLIIDKKNFKIKKSKIIFDKDSHLSFPAILRINDSVYLYPENSASGASMIYRYNPFTDEFDVADILCDQPLTDAVITNYFAVPIILSTRLPFQNGNTVFVYKSIDLVGQYHECQKIVLNDNTARSAGNMFMDGNKIIRPAQNCNGHYGIGLVFQEIIQIDDGSFVVKELFRKNPPKGYEGMHTYNKYKGYSIVDLHVRRHPLIHKILQSLKHLGYESN